MSKYKFYLERKDGSYLCIDSSIMEGCVNVFQGSSPSLAWSGVSGAYLQGRCRRVGWSDLPDEWKRAFEQYLGEDLRPEDKRDYKPRRRASRRQAPLIEDLDPYEASSIWERVYEDAVAFFERSDREAREAGLVPNHRKLIAQKHVLRTIKSHILH